MSLVSKSFDWYDSAKSSLCHNVRHFNPLILTTWMYNKILFQERGTEMPYYMPNQLDAIKSLTNFTVRSLTGFLHSHESELNRDSRSNHTYFKRIMYVTRNFYIYSNDTMANLYFTTKMRPGDYQRMRRLYNQAFVAFLAWNTLAGTAFIALGNFYFRSRKATVPTALLLSVPVLAAMWVNYHLSDGLKNYLINQKARRLGYGDLVVYKTQRYPRNVELSRY